ncbi:hypothetical protein AGMMS50293_21560 [Spirochaetia bacterium]|nr:hypothetical protein AGMMS50293_21560 [Spirochaetia bacterium]
MEIKGTKDYDGNLNLVEISQNQLKTIENELQLIIPNNIDFSAKYDDRKAVVLYFEDKRLADIAEAKTAQGLRTEIEENRKVIHDRNIGNKLEQHLLN